MTHVLDASGRIKESWGTVPLNDLDGYARGSIIRGGAADWEAYDAKTAGAVLIGDGVDVISDTTPTFVGVVTFNAGITMGGASGVNELTIPGNQAIAFEILDTNAIEYLRIDTAPQLGVIWNFGEADVDFRVAASGITNALYVQGSTGYIGIGTIPGVSLHIVGAANPEMYLAQAGGATFHLQAVGNAYGLIAMLGAHRLGLGVSNAAVISIATSGYVGIGPANPVVPATLLELERVEALAGALADGYAAGLTLDPGYDTGAHAVARHNYIDVQQPSVADGASVTAAAVMRFDAAIGTHKALQAAFQTTDSGADTTDWALGLIINVLGTLYKIPAIAV